MSKKLLSLLLLLALLLSLPLGVWATETESTEETEDVSGEGSGAICGEGLAWVVSGDTLTIFGTGEMLDFKNGAPWKGYKDVITTVVLENEVTTIGAYAFYDYDKLTTVNFGGALVGIGDYAFYDCDSLTSINLPRTFKRFGESAFQSCGSLKEIHCGGGFPRFNTNCLWDTYCTIYYPADAPWSVIYIEQLETAFQGRIEFLDSNGEDHYTPTEPLETTEAATEAATEAPTEAPTTEATTVPTTEAPTQAPTTEPETTQPETTQDPTRETFLLGQMETTTQPTQPERDHTGSRLGIAIVAATLSMIAFACLIFRITSKPRHRRR